MRIFLYSLVLLSFAFPAIAQNYHPVVPVSKYYYQCASRMGPTQEDINPGFKSPEGYIGLFQFSVYTAYQAGLCSKPVPMMRKGQLWKLCDFKGPVAEKYNIHSQYDLRFDAKTTAAQFEMMRNLTKVYDDYIYQKRYDLFFGKFISGVTINPDVLRAFLHAKGHAAVDDFLHGNQVSDNRTRGLYSLGSCFNQCITTKGKRWFCD